MSPPLGVDVSEYQGRPDWPRVAASGVSFAIARVAYGLVKIDDHYAYNRTAIPDAGLIPGAYHFLLPGQSAAQADRFCGLADPGAMHALDVERPGLDVPGWIARYRAHYPSKPLMIYAGRDLWHEATGTLNGAQYGPLWVAGSEPNGYVPGAGSLPGLAAEVGSHRGGLPWGGWSAGLLLQFTDKARVPGIDGAVDGDLCLGTLDDLRALAGTGADDMQLSELAGWDVSGLVGAKPGSVNFQTLIGRVYTATQATEAAVTGLTPAAVAEAVRAAFPGGLVSTGGTPLDADQLAAAVAAKIDVRAQVAEVLLHGAAGLSAQ